MEETKGRTSDLRTDERTDGRHQSRSLEKEDSGLEIIEQGQIPDHEESDADSRENLQQQRDVEKQRRSHETESRSWEQNTAITSVWGGSGPIMMFDDRTQGRHDTVLSCVYPIRPGVPDCEFYLMNRLCGFGSSCRYNHPPPQEIPDRIGQKLDCKFFKVGACKRGSRCLFHHPRDNDGIDPGLPIKRARRQGDIDGQRKKQLERKRLEAQDYPQKLRLQFRYTYTQENHNVEAHDLQKAQEQRQREIERLRREARLRLDQIKPTVFFNDTSELRKSLREFGIRM